MRIAVCIIATGNYKKLLHRLITDIDRFFLLNHEITVYLFHDSDEITNLPIPSGTRLNFKYHQIPPYKFPEATLFRYKIMTEIIYSEEYIFYIDADMGIVENVGDEFLGDIIAVRHPGFFNQACNSWEKNEGSECYIPEEKRRHYYAGGVQGGKTECYYTAMSIMKRWIDNDLSNGITPIWHDETAWNKYLTTLRVFIEVDCSYCMPESSLKRIRWGINKIKPKILALEKNFKLMRQ